MKVARPAQRRVAGSLKVHPDGFAFLRPDDGAEDIHITAAALGVAMDGDRAEVDWWTGPRGLEGRVARVLERARRKLTGQIFGGGRAPRFEPDDPRIRFPVRLVGGPGAARPGVSVLAEVRRYPEHAGDAIEAAIVRVLGDPADPATEIEKILAMRDISEDFPPEVVRQVARAPREVEAADRRDRVDLRHVPFTTIDPETARDFDDAVALEAGARGGHRLWVAVADVSHYVRPGEPVDVEAERRGCSTYLPHRAIPMLPEPLSAHICSLVPGEDRLAMVVRIDLDRDATVTGTDFCTAVIHSRARLDYPGVAAALKGDLRGPRKKYEVHLPALRDMEALAQRLRERRRARGALDLDLPEAVVDLDQDDFRRVRNVRRARRDPGERGAYSMIEEFMLAANEAVAESFATLGEQTLWRIHAPPDEGRIEEFAALAERYGVPVDREAARTPRGLARVLARLAGHKAEKALAYQLLRSLKQATYDAANVGHFGLASEAYLHFTSPIRRYPDLVVHRLLKRRLAAEGKPAGGPGPRATAAADRPLVRIAADASSAERRSMEAEREVLDLFRALYMRDRVGEVYDGRVTGVAGFGLFVAVEEPFVEGLVPTDVIEPDDYYVHDEAGLRLVGRRTGRAFALGDAVRVEVLSVSVARRKLTLRIQAPHGQKKSTAHGETKPERRRGQSDGRGHDRRGDKTRSGSHADDRRRRRDRPSR